MVILLNFYNENNRAKKQLGNFLSTSSTKDFIEQLKKEGADKPYISSRGGNTREIKDNGKWMHPKLFIDFAMWLSVEFKSKVIDMVLDGLIISRNDAGDYYNQMCATIMEVYCNRFGTKPPSNIYIKEANMLKKIANLEIDRNEMTEKDLNRLTVLQKVNANLIRRQVGIESRKKHLEIINDSLI
jgi:hypothetical protein